jgi:hypothetical protein
LGPPCMARGLLPRIFARLLAAGLTMRVSKEAVRGRRGMPFSGDGGTGI